MTGSSLGERLVEPDWQLITNSLVVVSGQWRLSIILTLGEQRLWYSQLSSRLPEILAATLNRWFRRAL